MTKSARKVKQKLTKIEESRTKHDKKANNYQKLPQHPEINKNARNNLTKCAKNY